MRKTMPPRNENKAKLGVITKDGKGQVSRFAPGSIFAVNCSDAEATTVTVAAGTSLTISTASASSWESDGSELQYRAGGKQTPSVTICMFDDTSRTFSGLGLTSEGPRTFDLIVVNGSGNVLDNVSVCGSVSRTGANYSNSNAISMEVETFERVEEKETTAAVVKEPVSSKKRKLDAAKQAKDLLDELRERQEADNNNSSTAKKSKKSVQEDETVSVMVQAENDFDDNKEEAPAPPPQPLTKKQRRKLAKQKAKELEEAVSTLMGHAAKDSRVLSKKKKAVLPSNKERRLAGGVIVQDVILGQGTVVQTGRQVSICYEGRLKEDGKVFDRNRNKKAPLSFRPGTGQVVAGLEKGIEGMRVGGEREITIPPELGYGRKGSGAVIPADATLVFTVQLISAGNE